MTKKKARRTTRAKKEDGEARVRRQHPEFASACHQHLDFLIREYEFTCVHEKHGYAGFIKYAKAPTLVIAMGESGNLAEVSIGKLDEHGVRVDTGALDILPLADEAFREWINGINCDYDEKSPEYSRDMDRALKEYAAILKAHPEILAGDLTALEKVD